MLFSTLDFVLSQILPTPGRRSDSSGFRLLDRETAAAAKTQPGEVFHVGSCMFRQPVRVLLIIILNLRDVFRVDDPVLLVQAPDGGEPLTLNRVCLAESAAVARPPNHTSLPFSAPRPRSRRQNGCWRPIGDLFLYLL